MARLYAEANHSRHPPAHAAAPKRGPKKLSPTRSMPQLLPGRNYAPRRLPKLGGEGAAAAAPPPPPKAPFVVDAFPDYGGKTRSGLRAHGPGLVGAQHTPKPTQRQPGARRQPQQQADIYALTDEEASSSPSPSASKAAMASPST